MYQQFTIVYCYSSSLEFSFRPAVTAERQYSVRMERLKFRYLSHDTEVNITNILTWSNPIQVNSETVSFHSARIRKTRRHQAA